MGKGIGYGTAFGITTATTDVWDDTAGLLTTNTTHAGWVNIGYLRNIEGPATETGEADVTTYDSTLAHREILPTLIDDGSITGEIVWDSQTDSHQKLTNLKESREIFGWKIVHPTTTILMVGRAFLQTLSPSYPIDDGIAASVSFRVTGAISWPSTV